MLSPNPDRLAIKNNGITKRDNTGEPTCVILNHERVHEI